MTGGPWVVDKSALLRLSLSVDADDWLERINRGLLSVCTVTVLETGFSARNLGEWDALVSAPPVSDLVPLSLTPRMEARAVDVQRLLTARGTQRAPSVADLLIAAAAELTGKTVLHVDKDFELIAEVTGQPVERLRLSGD